MATGSRQSLSLAPESVRIKLLPGEELKYNTDQKVSLFVPTSPQEQIEGVVFVTTYRFLFLHQDDVVVDVPLCSIERIEKLGGSKSRGDYGLEITCKDFRKYVLVHDKENHSRRSTYDMLKDNAFDEKPSKLMVENIKRMFAFPHFLALNGHKNVGWTLYNVETEFRRMGMPEGSYRISDVNLSYDVCDTYPARLLVPALISDDQLRAVADFRSRGRIPVVSWYSAKYSTSITRCSQPETGLLGRRNAADEELLNTYCKMSKSRRLHIMDARPRVNAIANQAKGGGFENEENYMNCSLHFLDIQNIHVIRESLQKVRDLCEQSSDDDTWYAKLDESGWLKHIKLILLAGNETVRMVKEGFTVLTHCSDGWDRTSQMTGLSMLLLDPYYRTITGFEVLLEKEWTSFGHKFHRRVGHRDADFKDEQRSPIFVQFLDCVWQVLRQFPTSFEFTSALLIEILESLFSCRFGTFLCDTDKQRKESNLASKTISLWSHINDNRDQFVNVWYHPHEQEIVVSTAMRDLHFWQEYYMRWLAIKPKRAALPSMELQSRELHERCKKLEAKCEALESQFNC